MEINMISIGKRIKNRRNELGLKHKDFDRECGIASGALSQIENGSRVPSAITLYKISSVLNCSVDWLITGESSFEKNEGLSKKDIDLLNNFRKLPDDEQDELIEISQMKLRKLQKIKEPIVKSSLSTSLKDDNMVV